VGKGSKGIPQTQGIQRHWYIGAAGTFRSGLLVFFLILRALNHRQARSSFSLFAARTFYVCSPNHSGPRGCELSCVFAAACVFSTRPEWEHKAKVLGALGVGRLARTGQEKHAFCGQWGKSLASNGSGLVRLDFTPASHPAQGRFPRARRAVGRGVGRQGSYKPKSIERGGSRGSRGGSVLPGAPVCAFCLYTSPA